MIEIINSIRKYNFWDSNPIDLGYPRTSYTDKIGQYVGNKLVKVLVGQRRAGKSYILRQIASKLISEGVKSENILWNWLLCEVQLSWSNFTKPTGKH